MNPKFEAEKQKILEVLAVYREKFGKEPSLTTKVLGTCPYSTFVIG